MMARSKLLVILHCAVGSDRVYRNINLVRGIEFFKRQDLGLARFLDVAKDHVRYQSVSEDQRGKT